jgi:hypothetical protein
MIWQNAASNANAGTPFLFGARILDLGTALILPHQLRDYV